jgi:hypothetical protein
MKILLALWNHRTAISGGLQASSALMGASGTIPLKAAGLIALGIGLVQIWIGVANSIASGKKE